MNRLSISCAISMKHKSLTQKQERRKNGASFHLSPDPLLRALPHLRVSYVPPPPGRGDERAMVDLREAGGGLVCSPILLVPYRSLAHRSFVFSISICGAMWVDCDACRFCQLVFSLSVSEWV